MLEDTRSAIDTFYDTYDELKDNKSKRNNYLKT